MEIPLVPVTWPGAVLPGEEAFPQVEPKTPGVQFVDIILCLIAWNHPEELGSIVFTYGSPADLFLASFLPGETIPAPSTSTHGASALGP